MYIHILSSTYTYAQIYVYVYNSYIHNGLCALIRSAMVDLLVFSLGSETSQFGGIFYWREQRAFSLEDWPNHLDPCLRYFEITTLEPLRHFETPMQNQTPTDQLKNRCRVWFQTQKFSNNQHKETSKRTLDLLVK